MVKKFLVIALAMAVVAPSVKAVTVAVTVSEEVQAAAELRLSEVTGKTLTAEDKEVLKDVVEATLESLPVSNESKFSKKTFIIVTAAVVAAFAVVYVGHGLIRGEWKPWTYGYWHGKEATLKRAQEKSAAAQEAAAKETDATKKKALEDEKAAWDKEVKRLNTGKLEGLKKELEGLNKKTTKVVAANGKTFVADKDGNATTVEATKEQLDANKLATDMQTEINSLELKVK